MLRGFASETPFSLGVSKGGFPLWEENVKKKERLLFDREEGKEEEWSVSANTQESQRFGLDSEPQFPHL